MVLSYFIITRKTIETVLKKIENIAIKLKKIVSKKNEPEEPILRVYCFIAALMFFGFVIGHYIKKDWSVSFLGIIFLVMLITNMENILIKKGDKNSKKVKVGISEDNGIKVMEGWLLKETSSEIYFEVKGDEDEQELSEKEVKKSYIYRYNKSDIKYIKRELTDESSKTKKRAQLNPPTETNIQSTNQA